MAPEPSKVLVVDDTPSNVRLLDAILSPRGYAVVTAGSGPEALLRATQDAPAQELKSGKYSAVKLCGTYEWLFVGGLVVRPSEE